MVKHIILLGSSYYNGTRIALDYTNVDKYYGDFPINANQFDNDRVALHTMVTESDSWESVQHSDPFFKIMSQEIPLALDDGLNWRKKRKNIEKN